MSSNFINDQDEVDFVFLDDAQRPYRVMDWEDKTWIFYWHPDGKWVSLRKATFPEVICLAEKALPQEQAQLYHDEHAKHSPQLPTEQGGNP